MSFFSNNQYTSAVIKEGGLRLWNHNKKQWRDVYCKLQQSGWFYWFEKSKSNKPIHGVDFKVIAAYFAHGELVKCMPVRPGGVADNDFQRIFAVPIEPNDRCDIHFFICTNEAEMNSWMTSIFNLLEQPVPPQYQVSAPSVAYNSASRPTSPFTEPPLSAPGTYSVAQPVPNTVPVMLLRGYSAMPTPTATATGVPSQQVRPNHPLLQPVIALQTAVPLNGISQPQAYYRILQTPPPSQSPPLQTPPGPMMSGFAPVNFPIFQQSSHIPSAPHVPTIYALGPDLKLNLPENTAPGRNSDQRLPENTPKQLEKRQTRSSNHRSNETEASASADQQGKSDLHES